MFILCILNRINIKFVSFIEIAVNFIEKHPVECKDFYNADEILKHVFYTEANTCTELFSILNNLSEFINSKNVGKM